MNYLRYTDHQNDPHVTCMLASRVVPYWHFGRLIRHVNKCSQITFFVYVILATFTCLKI